VPSKKPAEKAAAPKRRSPISRAEGERRLIAAAKQLIQEKPYSTVGVREVGLLADVNHGFVHTWFGGKNELLVAVLKDQLLAMAVRVSNAPPGRPIGEYLEPEIIAMVRLRMWLDLEGVNTDDLFRGDSVVEALTTRYIEVEKIDPSIARETALQGVAIALGAAAFGPTAGWTPEDAVPVMKLWRHILKLLAEHPQA
jgi:AcrR family transcriptional regulator